MRRLAKNMRNVWYATFSGIEDITDSDGNIIGSQRTYSKPCMIRANVSAAVGSADTEQFGVNLDYDKTINPLPSFVPIDETSVLWIDARPTINSDGTTDVPWEYTVAKVAQSLNHKAVAIKRVDVS